MTRRSAITIAVACLQWVALPALGTLAGAWTSGYLDAPRTLPPDLGDQIDYWKAIEAERLEVRLAAVGCGLFAGVLTALSFCMTAALWARRPILHSVALAIALPVAHVLWVEPFWGFHHTQLLGILGWYGLDFEEGRSVGPTCVSPLTLLVWIGFVVLAQSLLRTIVRWPNSSAELERAAQ